MAPLHVEENATKSAKAKDERRVIIGDTVRIGKDADGFRGRWIHDMLA